MEYFSVSGLRKVYPYYFTFTTFTKGRWVGEKILEVFGREFRAHPVEEYVSGSNQYLIFSLLRHSKPLELLLSSGEMYPRWNADGQLRAGGRGLQAEAQRPARQHRPQVPNPITGTARYFSLSHPETSPPFQARDPGAVQAHRHRPSLRGPGRPGQALLAPG